MKKIGKKEIITAILNEAVTIKRKKELFNEAQKINSELKQLNEVHPGALLGWGFKNSNSPSPVIGSGPIQQGMGSPEAGIPDGSGFKLDQFHGLEKDINDFEQHDEENIVDAVQKLKDENEELKAQLSQIKNAVESLNENKKPKK